MNVRAPRIALSRQHSIIALMMSAVASPASVVRGPLPVHLDTLSKVPPPPQAPPWIILEAPGPPVLSERLSLSSSSSGEEEVEWKE